MTNDDFKFMKEAIDWANDCRPMKDSIPKVGAIFAVGASAIARGRRGTGKVGDDEHAEWNAIHDVMDPSKLSQSTLYTTLEPCTGAVRSKPLESCTELIRQHQIKKVFVGILDPNQGVTGKGILSLQESGVEVALFPHDLSKQVLAQNAAFIRSQKSLGAVIISPKDGEDLRTYDTAGRHPVRFKSLNPPGSDTYLLTYRGGLYWPQPGPFRNIEANVWEIDAHFGTTGEHTLQLVTANSLGGALFGYYRKVVTSNQSRRERLREKVDPSLLGGDYPGIEMNGLPKGLQLEASVSVFIAHKVELKETFVHPTSISRGQSLTITYEVECWENIPSGIWLGASLRDKSNKLFCNPKEDKAVALVKGTNTVTRTFTIAKDAPLGEQPLGTNLWRGVAGDSSKSKWIDGKPPIAIHIH
jgi:pyrimidine deaminase RibD-like protein